MDTLSRQERSVRMAKIRSSATGPERAVWRELRKRQIYFARNVGSLEGKPDIVFRRKRVAIFIDSDFWHGHPQRFRMPKSNRKYWTQKIERNKLRDRQVTKSLRASGWNVIRVWEFDTKRNLDSVMRKILFALESDSNRAN